MARPQLDLDWEEGLFKTIRSLWRAVVPEKTQFDDQRAATLGPLTRRLSILASMVAGTPLRVLPARELGGLRGDDVLVPAWLELAPDPEANAALYVLRAVAAGAMHRRLAQDPSQPFETLLAGAVADLREELSAFGPAWDAAVALQHAHAQIVLWGPLIDFTSRIEEGSAGEEEGPNTGVTSEAEAGPIEELEVVSLDEQKALAMPVHSFEKVEFAEAWNGTMRQLDGEDDLDDHLESLEEVDLGTLLRGGPQAHSLLKADIALDAEIPDITQVDTDEPHLSYDEWDGRKRRYRPGWCRVYPTAMPRGDEVWAQDALARHRNTVQRLHGQLARHRARLAAQPRQLDGEDVDIDAMTDAWASLHAGHTPNPRLYLRQARHRRSLATLVLLDVSLSTDSWVAGRRVLDVARESVLVLGEVADRLGDELAVMAFASHTRHKVRAWMVRDWHEPWTDGRGRLGRLEPQGYTRIGPALRHATAMLRKVDARDRVLLFVSDGKPTDYDRYEGRYGMSDVRQALREARQIGIKVHALAIDEVAQEWLPAMLGPGSWDVLPRPEALPEALTKAYGRLG